MRYHFEGALGLNDAKRHIEHAFVLSHDASGGHEYELRICLWHSDGDADGLSNMLTLTVFDPEGFRGAGHRMGEPRDGGHAHDVSISVTNATPGYSAGTIQPGNWAIVIDAHRITGAEPCFYRLDVELLSVPTTASRSAAATSGQGISRPALRAPGALRDPHDSTRGGRWFRGDLHAHTVHSDGEWEVSDLVAWARQRELDFVTLSDHNTVAGLAQMDAQSSRALLTIGGLELTTFYGHALALGVREWVDWRVGADIRRRTMPAIAQEVEAAGGLFIIAHPMAIGDPICTGCRWTYPDMMPGAARIVEIWNGAWDNLNSHNELGLALFYEWLNCGHRLAATAGTDIHDASQADAQYGFNVVFAEAHTEQAILEAIRQGHLFLSSRPHVECVAHSESGVRAMMGAVLPIDQSAALTVMWRACVADDRLRLIVDGEPRHETRAGQSGVLTWHFDAGQAHWVIVEIRDGAGRIAAITNPIFFSR